MIVQQLKQNSHSFHSGLLYNWIKIAVLSNLQIVTSILIRIVVLASTTVEGFSLQHIIFFLGLSCFSHLYV